MIFPAIIFQTAFHLVLREQFICAQTNALSYFSSSLFLLLLRFVIENKENKAVYTYF
jgi:hypothetical protein